MGLKFNGMLEENGMNQNYGRKDKQQRATDSAAIFFLLGILYIVCCVLYVFFG